MPRSGHQLGPYEIIAKIGAGSMGEVYRARDPRLGRDVAIKVLAPGIADNADRRTRFEQEARAAAALNHPNILAVFDIGQADGSPYIVSELLEGETLRHRLKEGPLSIRRALDYATQIAQGLAAAHARGIVHRDLKPENIYIAAGDRIKILDLGLAKLTEREPSSGVGSVVPTNPPGTQPGMILGTLGYMAPEQVRGVPADHRSDIFSFGAILYEMLTGQPPFQRDTPADTMSAILHDTPPDLSTQERHIPAPIVRIVERCLEKAPADRFHSTDDLAFALASGLASDSEIRAIQGSIPVQAASSRRFVWAAALALVALVAATAGAFLYLQRQTSDPLTVKLNVAPPSGVVQVEPTIRISPDGSRLAFVATTSDGTRRLWMRPLNALEAAPMGDTEGATSPFWSPDSRSIGFFAGGQLKRIDIGDSSSTVLAEAPQAAGGSWSSDGLIVFSSAGQLYRVPAAGGAVSLLNGVNGKRAGATLAYPTFLPDNRRILYLDTGGGRVGEAALYGAEIDSPERTLVLEGAASNAWYSRGYLFFLRSTTLVAQPFDPARLTLSGGAVPIVEEVQRPQFGPPSGAFSVSDRVLAYQTSMDARGVATRLAWFDRSGKETGTVGEQADYGDVELSPDSRQVAVSRLDPGVGRDIWIFDLARGIPTRFTADPADEYASVWSPDGSRLIFNSRRQGNLDLYEKASSGAGSEEVVLADRTDKSPMSWSTGGQILLFNTGNVSIVGNQVDLWALPLTETEPREPFPVINSAFNEARGRLSPDGRWIAYTSDESGQTEIYVTSFPSRAGKWRVSTAGGNWPRWSRDGTEIFFLSADSTHLMSARVDGRGSQFAVGTIATLFRAPWRLGARYPYDVSDDGRILAAVLVDQPAPTPITLTVNWLDGLRR